MLLVAGAGTGSLASCHAIVSQLSRFNLGILHIASVLTSDTFVSLALREAGCNLQGACTVQSSYYAARVERVLQRWKSCRYCDHRFISASESLP